MDDRRGNGTMEHENKGSPRESIGSTGTTGTGTHGDEDGSSSTSAPRSAPVANQPHGSRAGQQLAAVPRRSTPRHGVDTPGLQEGQAQGSGKKPPQPTVCPRPPPLPPRRQQRPHGLQVQWWPAFGALVANRPIGQQRGGAPAIQSLRPSFQAAGPPQAHPAPRADELLSTHRPGILLKQPMPIPETRSCLVCRVAICSCNICSMYEYDAVCWVCAHGQQAAVPAIAGPPQAQPNDQRPPPPRPPGGAGVPEQLQRMAIRPVGVRGEAPGGTAAQLGFQRPLQAHLAPRAENPVGIHFLPLLPGPALCPVCRFFPAPTLFQPWWHVCVCDSCRSIDGVACLVCKST